VGGKWTRFRKQIPEKTATGKTVETKHGPSENSIILPLGPFNSTSTVTRNIVYESWR